MEPKTLPTEVIANLKAIHKSSRDKKEADIIKAIILMDNGYTLTQVSKILLMDDETVRRRVNEYLEKGKLLPQKPAGRSEILSKASLTTLFAEMRRVIFHDSKQVIHFIKERFGIKYSQTGIIALLKRHGFSYRYTVNVPPQADLAKQKAFLEQYETLKSTIHSEQEVIIFIDAAHPQNQAKLCKGWFAIAEDFKVKNGASRTRINILGAMEHDTKDVTYAIYETIDSDAMLDFFKQLIKKHGQKKIHAILDNGAYNKSEKVTQFANENNIVLHFLPAYSPNLNLIERFWKCLKQHVSYGKYYKTKKEFEYAIADFLNNFRNIFTPTQIQAKFKDAFHLLDSHPL